MVQHYVLTLNGSVQRLSSVLPGATADQVAQEKTWSFLSLQADSANTHVVYVGGYPQVVSSSAFGFVVPIPVTSIPAAPIPIQPGQPSLRLSEWQVLGTNGEKLVLCVKD